MTGDTGRKQRVVIQPDRFDRSGSGVIDPDDGTFQPFLESIARLSDVVKHPDSLCGVFCSDGLRKRMGKTGCSGSVILERLCAKVIF